MNKEDAIQIESSQRQHHEVMEYQSRMSFCVTQEELGIFAILKPKLFQDGNQWCVLYGDDLQVGIAGFGDTPYEAIRDWNKAWHIKA